MYLTALSLKDFAGLGAVSLEDFEPGLNVIVGDNEAGKSTLLVALRAAFFQKHRAGGEAVKALAPYGRTVRPEISVGFTTGGTEYSLSKGFLQRPEAALSWPGGALSGDAVEDKLAELLGFAHSSGARLKRDEHQGAFGLLWVEQGRSHEHDLDLGVGRNAVTASLEGEIGQILGGERGRSLLAAAEARQAVFFTATGRPSGTSPLVEAEKRLQALRAELAERLSARDAYEEKIERLRRRREVLKTYLDDDAVAKAEAAVDAAEAESRAVEGFAAAHDGARRDLEAAEARRAAAAERLAARERLAKALAEATARRDAAAVGLEDLRRSQAAERAELVRLEAARTAARADFAEAEAAHEAGLARADFQRVSAEITRLEARIAEAAALEKRLAELGAAPAQRLDRAALKGLEAAEQARREAEIRMAATAPTVTFAPDAGASVRTADGSPLAGGTALPVLARSAYDLSGFGRVTIEPGGDAAQLRRAFDEAAAALQALLARHRVSSLDDFRQKLRAAEEQANATALLKTQLATLLPEGMAAAAAALAAQKAALALLPAGDEATGPASATGATGATNEVEAKGAALPAVGAAAAGMPGLSTDDATAARARRREAETCRAAADAAVEAARKLGAALDQRLARTEAEAEHLARTASDLAAQRAAAEEGRTAAALAEDLAAADVDRSAKAAVVALRRRALDAADPETVARSLLARRRALDEIRRTVAGLREETSALEGELRAEGLSSLGEDIARLEGESEALAGRVRRLTLEAAASKLLHTELCAAQRAAREHWLGPIKAQVAPFLRLIHPESEIAFDDASLAITGLNRRGVAEEFKRLSAGAREQVAVVTRLALATVLKRGGHPALVILDDALVNTDEERLKRMHLVLQKAAEAMQIVVLTCRERDFRDLGGKMFRL
ncbi:AAA family ATPase [Aureimonas glaciei]|uniref:Rad50/SbcC-type AAA domain-containing protein n=1 Tax=Aureimonas glaciei TaxID=1776957 RepID=A0A916XV45_9HYPH|nr:AAA family ATPase [Aureimonas glaciei]GGD13034.1 hypothetical protein GCM10011335_14840 [Aureimonas glaciei]